MDNFDARGGYHKPPEGGERIPAIEPLVEEDLVGVAGPTLSGERGSFSVQVDGVGDVIESNELEYPFIRHDDLIIDDFYRDLQAKGPVRVQLPYGEPCGWRRAIQDVRTVYGDRRFGRELGAGHDVPRMMSLNFADNPAIIANMDPPRHTRLRRLALDRLLRLTDTEIARLD